MRYLTRNVILSFYLMILSLSSEGLQNSLDKLYTYCSKWEMEVSTIKTNIMVFNTSGRLLKGKRFHYNGINLEQVKEFNYLGTTFSFRIWEPFICKRKIKNTS